MHAIDQKPVELLNTLIGINNERKEAYSYASQEADVEILKDLFSRLSETSDVCRHELSLEVQKLGGTPAHIAAAPQECFRAWLDVIAAITRRDHEAILRSCLFGENVVLRSYSNVLESQEEINSQQQRLLSSHLNRLRDDEEKVKNLLHVLQRAA